MSEGIKYRRLEKGEIIQEGDEVDACRDGWRDPPEWEPDFRCIGEPAPDPQYPSHRQYRRRVDGNPDLVELTLKAAERARHHPQCDLSAAPGKRGCYCLLGLVQRLAALVKDQRDRLRGHHED